MNRIRTGLASTFALATFLSAFLVFQVQPVISKCVLPWFGGSPAVWTTCMLFFQVVLFGGYAYAHGLVCLFAPRWQGAIHFLLLTATLCVLPITPSETWKPAGDGNPTWQILAILAANVGLPYFLLAATGPLLQAWFRQSMVSSRSPYRLYALSNIGSLAALLTYPTVVEPAFAIVQQGSLWSMLFCVFSVLCAFLAASLARPAVPNTAHDGTAADPNTEARPSAARALMWLLLPMLASTMLLATTNHVCQDVAVIPFLWIAPLALYLITFILCFEREWWYVRPYFVALTMISLLAIFLVQGGGFLLPLVPEIAVYLVAMFFVCMVAHGELVRSKPAAKYLTTFYLCSSAGGALGGVFVGLICPLVFDTFYELHLCLLTALAVSFLLGCHEMRDGFLRRPQRRVVAALLLVTLLSAVAPQPSENRRAAPIVSIRNFYGTLKIDVASAGRTLGMSLLHGRIIHGFQFADAERIRLPTTYYARESGVGLALTHLRSDTGLRVGAVGLGVGTVAAYGQENDYFRFYEINPAIVDVARNRFEYLSTCPAEIDIQLGDARLSLEREPIQMFDILVLDAFSGESVPAHLLTKEAFAIYRAHLQPAGVIAVHVSNRNLRLEPVVLRQAEHLKMECAMVINRPDSRQAVMLSKWMLLTNNHEFLARPEVRSVARCFSPRPDSAFPLWTDQYYNLLQILKVN